MASSSRLAACIHACSLNSIRQSGASNTTYNNILTTYIHCCAGMTCQFQRGYQLHCGFKLCKQLYCIMRRRVTRRLRDLCTSSGL